MTMADTSTAQQPLDDAETTATEFATDADDTTAAEDAAADVAPEIDAGPTAEQELLLMKDQLLRALAETENLRKRSARELEDANKYAITGFARDIVGVSENLHRGLQSIPAGARENDANMKVLAEGIELTLQELNGVLNRHGIRRIDPAGEKFDHNFHQAVAQVENPDVPNGNIIQVLQAGYIIHDRLLRPAMVAVSKGSPNGASAGVDTQA